MNNNFNWMRFNTLKGELNRALYTYNTSKFIESRNRAEQKINNLSIQIAEMAKHLPDGTEPDQLVMFALSRKDNKPSYKREFVFED